MANINLENILRQNEEPCLSIILPTQRIPEKNISNMEEAKKLVKDAGILLTRTYPVNTAHDLHQKLNDLFSQLSFKNNKEGLGLYVSTSMAFSVMYPFAVQAKIIIGDFFALSELLLLNEYNQEYYLLELNEKHVRLFKGQADELLEIKDQQFPAKQSSAYEYAKPSRGNSYAGHATLQSFEKDKSALETVRLRTFFAGLNDALEPYLSQGAFLIIAGAEKDLALFKAVSSYAHSTIAQIKGNYNRYAINRLSQMAWERLLAYFAVEKIKKISIYEEKRGEGLGVEGFANVTRAAESGRGLELLIEKDYDQLYNAARNGNSGKSQPGTANKLMKMVLDKGGKVNILENGRLKSQQGIALIMRY